MEFAYDLVVDPEAENNTHAFALGMIGHNKRVLEVGCATGYFTKVLAERGCKVVGLEIDPGAASLAEQWAERVVVGDVDNTELWDLVDDESFDVVTFGDVLEHLRDPLAILRKAATKLKPEGFIVTSLPNVAHGDVRLALLRGSFEYRDIGLLDRTHIRFFTRQSVRELLGEAGLVVVDTRRVIVPLFQTELGLKEEDYSDAVVDEIRADADCETYQFVMKSVIDNGSQAVADLAGRLGEAADQISELMARNRQIETQLLAYAERATPEYLALQEELGRLGEQIDAWAVDAVERNEQVKRLEEQLAVASAAAEEHAAAAQRLAAALEEVQGRYDQVTMSASYRLSAPARRLSALLRGGRQA
jgi:2-polyprenyl-3-methyl-5-hydroxy-6-metoxy-1,4-benzoquinol methylase